MKKASKLLLVVLSVSFLSLGTSSMAMQVSAQTVMQQSQTITPRADIIDWRYKVVDGHLYARQYNYTQQEWVGEWIRC